MGIRRKAEALAKGLEAKQADLRWWLKDEPHQAVFSLTERIDRNLRRRQSDYLDWACLYDDSELASLIAGGSAIAVNTPDALAVNIVRRQVDTYTAKITKNRPVPMATTSEAGYSARRRAKTLTRFFEGVLKEVGYYDTRPLRIRDGAIFGSGFAHNYRVGKKLVHERVFPWELSVDPREARYGRPRSLYKTTLVDRLVLLDRFPEFEEEIFSCASKSVHAIWDADDETSNLALVREAWHLRSGDDADDGAHSICISNATLSKGKYDRDYFPFSHNRFSYGLAGFFGEGMVKFLAPVQGEVNEIGMRLQEMAYGTGTYVWVPDGSGIEVDTLDNGSLSVIRSALRPEFFQPPPWHPQLFTYYEKLRTEFASGITGISDMMARGEVPQGLDSGKAIRTFNQIAAENLIPQGREDERDCVATAWQLLDLMEEILDEGHSFETKLDQFKWGRNSAEDLDFKKARMDRETFTLSTFPVSFLSTTPEDKWSQVQEMAKSGLFDQEDIALLMDMPDVQFVMNKRGAPRMVVEKIIETILEAEDPKPITPEPTMNLDLCVGLGTTAYLIAKWIDEVDEKNTATLLEFVVQARTMRDLLKGGPQPGSQSVDATAETDGTGAAPVNQPGVDPTYVAPDQPLLPAGATAPTVMPAMNP